ncbi:hypothetical protein [Desulfocurvus sp.]|jgi:hypothetical protein|uniref:hypothetical protein n=1 Tax=Desulfocurvus sp. TaxID=2871698 RepID=UPI0025B89271|nr:hypothetical protein [Desulfocurvus sp.]MCK9240319.1 hypothetical protein [Desulfocurvus sp.]
MPIPTAPAARARTARPGLAPVLAALILCLLLAGCMSSGRFMDTLTEGLGSGEEPRPLGGVQGAQREAWLGPLEPLAGDSDLEELELAFEELPAGLDRRWLNFETQVQWEVSARGVPEARQTPEGLRRTLQARATPQGGATARAPLTALRDDKGRWQPAGADGAPLP